MFTFSPVNCEAELKVSRQVSSSYVILPTTLELYIYNICLKTSHFANTSDAAENSPSRIYYFNRVVQSWACRNSVSFYTKLFDWENGNESKNYLCIRESWREDQTKNTGHVGHAKIFMNVFSSPSKRKSESTHSKTAKTECRETSFFKFAEKITSYLILLS